MRILTLLFLAACSDAPSAAHLVGKTGGTVRAADGSAVTIGPLALTVDTNVSIVPTPAAPTPPSTTTVGTPYTFGPEGTQFSQPVTVTLAYTLPAGRRSDEVVIYTAPAGSTKYTRLTTSVVDADHVAAQVSHFSVFLPAVVADEPVDLARAPIDLSAPDLTAAPDLSPADCVVTCSSNNITCRCSDTCGGVTYSMLCEMGSGGTLACNCLGGGISKVVSGTGDCTTTTALPALYNQCGFPL